MAEFSFVTWACIWAPVGTELLVTCNWARARDISSFLFRPCSYCSHRKASSCSLLDAPAYRPSLEALITQQRHVLRDLSQARRVTVIDLALTNLDPYLHQSVIRNPALTAQISTRPILRLAQVRYHPDSEGALSIP